MPAAVRRVDIPKPQGGVRTLGSPTVVDRLIQQALHQVLQPIFEPTFSDASFGFRPGRNAHQALRRARRYVASGKRWVVDMDLGKFFDRVTVATRVFGCPPHLQARRDRCPTKRRVPYKEVETGNFTWSELHSLRPAASAPDQSDVYTV